MALHVFTSLGGSRRSCGGDMKTKAAKGSLRRQLKCASHKTRMSESLLRALLLSDRCLKYIERFSLDTYLDIRIFMLYFSRDRKHRNVAKENRESFRFLDKHQSRKSVVSACTSASASSDFVKWQFTTMREGGKTAARARAVQL